MGELSVCTWCSRAVEAGICDRGAESIIESSLEVGTARLSILK